jgi:hypothetical protein
MVKTLLAWALLFVPTKNQRNVVTGLFICPVHTCFPNFPTTPGAFQTHNGGGDDAFVSKLNASGSALLYSTYLGGGGSDMGLGITVDSGGNAYVTGQTIANFPPNFPVTPGAFQSTYGGGVGDAFVSQLNPTGSALLYSTYLGGSGDEDVFDASHSAALAAASRSTVLAMPTSQAVRVPPTFPPPQRLPDYFRRD